ncbi:hypothetical protein ACIKTA_02775 [Hansschlegelia beijingensis]
MPHTFKRIPTFSRELQNTAPSPLAELEINANQAAGVSDFLLEMEARFSPLTLQPGDFSREVQLNVNVAYLHLHTEGCRISMKQYVGRDVIPQAFEIAHERSETDSSNDVSKRTTERSGEAQIGAFAKLTSLLKGTVATENAKGRNSTDKTTFMEKNSLFARETGNHWRIKDPRDRPLYGPTVPEDYFCKIEYDRDHGAVVGTLKAFPRDIKVEYQHDGQWNHNLLKFSARHRAVMNALVAKHLRSVNPFRHDDYHDIRIRLARCTLNFRETDEPYPED